MACGEWCVYYASKGISSACSTCAEYEAIIEPKFEFGKVDIFKLARLLKEKEEKERGES